MKNMIFLIYTVSALIFTGCYEDSKNATLRINLGNLHASQRIEHRTLIDRFLNLFSTEAYAQTVPQDLLRVHIGLYSGNTLILKKSIDVGDIPASQIIEFEVPAGDNRTVLIVGENNANQAGYYGYNNVNLQTGETADVTIAMTAARWDGTLGANSVPRVVTSNPNCSPAPFTMTWTSAGVKVRYLIIDNISAPIVKYSGYGNEYIDNSSNNYQFYVEFEDFNLRTYGDYINNC